MLRPRLRRLVGAAILAATLVLPASGIATAATPTTGTTPLPEIKLGCALVVPNPLAPDLPQPRRRVPLGAAHGRRHPRLPAVEGRGRR